MHNKSWANDMMDWLIYGKGKIPNLGDYLPEVPQVINFNKKVNKAFGILLEEEDKCHRCGKEIRYGVVNDQEVEFGHDEDCQARDIQG